MVVEQIYEHWKWPRSSYFFTDRPGINRVNGRLELVHDDWLYPVFESLDLAEPRSRWLGRAIVSGPVRAVVNTNDRSLIEGTTLDLRRLGFHSDASLGPFYVWTRERQQLRCASPRPPLTPPLQGGEGGAGRPVFPPLTKGGVGGFFGSKPRACATQL